MRFRPPWPLAFLLGGVLTLTTVRLTPFLVSGPADSEEVNLVIPALAEATYTYRQARGFLALLETSDGRRLELPDTWLPGEAAVGKKYFVATAAQPGVKETTFNVALRAVATTGGALSR